MDGHAGEPRVGITAAWLPRPRGKLFRKYLLFFAGIVATALIANGLLDIWFAYREQRALLVRVRREQADAAAAKISQFVKAIEGFSTSRVSLSAWVQGRLFTPGAYVYRSSCGGHN